MTRSLTTYKKKPNTVLERDVEGAVTRYAVSKGWLSRKFSSPQHSAVPDRINLFHGFVLFIEYKAPGKKPTTLQYKEHDKIRAAGGCVAVVDNIEQGKQLIDFHTTLVLGQSPA